MEQGKGKREKGGDRWDSSLGRQATTSYLTLQPAGGTAAQTRLSSDSGVAGGGAVGPFSGTSPDSALAQHLPAAGWGLAVSIAAAHAQGSSPEEVSLLL